MGTAQDQGLHFLGVQVTPPGSLHGQRAERGGLQDGTMGGRKGKWVGGRKEGRKEGWMDEYIGEWTKGRIGG